MPLGKKAERVGLIALAAWSEGAFVGLLAAADLAGCGPSSAAEAMKVVSF